MVRKCTFCGNFKKIDEFYKTKRDNITTECKACLSDRGKTGYRKNPERVIARSIEWQKNNRELQNEINRKSYKKHREKRLKHLKKRVDFLYDPYIKRLIISNFGIERDEITDDMIELKKTELIITREIKKIKRAVLNAY